MGIMTILLQMSQGNGINSSLLFSNQSDVDGLHHRKTKFPEENTHGERD
uniref:Uncharacterized protein n=1 Tax=Rhizophora mucronata TaxID=61149 RepID=A0A2P2PKB5_RHIMU